MRYFMHDIVRDLGELFGYNMRELIVLLLGVASEYDDRSAQDRFFAAVDAFNTVLKGEGYVEKIARFGKYTETQFDPKVFDNESHKKGAVIEEVIENPKPTKSTKETTSKQPAIEHSEIDAHLLGQDISDGSLLDSSGSGLLGMSVDASEVRIKHIDFSV